MCFQLLDVVALNNRAQFLSTDAVACCLDIGRDRVLALGSKTCEIVLVVRLTDRDPEEKG